MKKYTIQKMVMNVSGAVYNGTKNMSYKNFCRFIKRYNEMLISVKDRNVIYTKSDSENRLGTIDWYIEDEL